MKNLGILVIHGLNSCSEDMKELVDFLKDKGIDTRSPSLAGERGTREEWKNTTWQDWINIAEEQFLQLKNQYKKVIVIGYSMGGLVAVHLVHKYNADLLITISTPIYYGDHKKILANIKQYLKQKNYEYLKGMYRLMYNTPFLCYLNFKKFLRNTIPLFEQIKTPILIMQGLKDEVVKWTSADYIFNHVKSNCKKKIYYREVDHGIFESSYSGDVCNEIFHTILSIA